MRYFLDTEFDGFGGPLISLALVREDGESLYLMTYHEAKEPWVRENVVPILHDCPKDPIQADPRTLAAELGRFLGGDSDIHIVTDWPDDVRYFCGALIVGPGQMIATPPTIGLHIHRVDAYPTTLAGAVQHNAWWDAMALRAMYQ